MPTAHYIRFSYFIFDIETKELRKNDEIIALQPKQSEVLALLLENPDKLVSREEIRDKVWSEQVVEFDQSINFCIKCIRKALKDDPKVPQYIQTVPRRGYRFIAKTTSEVISTHEDNAATDQTMSGLASAPLTSQQQTTHTDQLLNSEEKPRNKPRSWLKGLSKNVFASGAGLVFVVTASSWWSNVVMSDRTSDIATQIETAQIETTAIDKNNHNNQFDRALYLFNKIKYQDRVRSRALFEKHILNNPKSVVSHAYLSMSYSLTAQNKADFIKAREHAQLAKYHATSGSNKEALLAEALVTFYDDWDIKKANVLLTQISKMSGDWPLVWHELAVTSAILGDIKNATHSIGVLLKISPGMAQERYHAGWFYMIAGRYDDALEQCLQGIEIEPNHAYGKLCAGQMASQLGLHEIAKRNYVSLIKQANKGSIPNELMSQINQHNYQAVHQWVFEFQQKSGAGHFNLALSLARLKKYDQALIELQFSIEKHESMLPTAWAFAEFKPLVNSPEFIEMMSVVKR